MILEVVWRSSSPSLPTRSSCVHWSKTSTDQSLLNWSLTVWKDFVVNLKFCMREGLGWRYVSKINCTRNETLGNRLVSCGGAGVSVRIISLYSSQAQKYGETFWANSYNNDKAVLWRGSCRPANYYWQPVDRSMQTRLSWFRLVIAL